MLDAPFVESQELVSSGNQKIMEKNFMDLQLKRIEYSRNLMTVRIAKF